MSKNNTSRLIPYLTPFSWRLMMFGKDLRRQAPADYVLIDAKGDHRPLEDDDVRAMRAVEGW